MSPDSKLEDINVASAKCLAAVQGMPHSPVLHFSQSHGLVRCLAQELSSRSMCVGARVSVNVIAEVCFDMAQKFRDALTSSAGPGSLREWRSVALFLNCVLAHGVQCAPFLVYSNSTVTV